MNTNYLLPFWQDRLVIFVDSMSPCMTIKEEDKNAIMLPNQTLKPLNGPVPLFGQVTKK